MERKGVLKVFIVFFRKFIFQIRKKILITLPLHPSNQKDLTRYDFTVQMATLSDVDELYQLVRENNYKRTKKEFSDWIKYGYSFFIAIDEDKIVGFRCGAFGLESIPSYMKRAVNKAIELRSDDAWGQDVFIHPSYRRKELSSILKNEVHNHLRDLGYQRIFSIITSDNLPMRSVCRKLGYKEIKEITFYKLFRINLIKITSLD